MREVAARSGADLRGKPAKITESACKLKLILQSLSFWGVEVSYNFRAASKNIVEIQLCKSLAWRLLSAKGDRTVGIGSAMQ
jgi:hypothetical protein